MLFYFLIPFVCLLAACGDQALAPTGGVGGTAGTAGAGGAPLRSELRDFSDFNSFSFSDAGPEQACQAIDMTSSAEIKRREDGQFDFTFEYLNIDEECGSPTAQECQTVERGGPRQLSDLEVSRVRTVFAEILMTGPTADNDFCSLTAEEGAEACDATFRWDDETWTDNPCVRLSVSESSRKEIRLMFDALRLRE